MTEKKRLSMRAKMLAWNKGYKTMQATLKEFGKDGTDRDVAAAVIGGCCANLLERGYDYITINALLTAQATTRNLWQVLHAQEKVGPPKRADLQKQQD